MKITEKIIKDCLKSWGFNISKIDSVGPIGVVFGKFDPKWITDTPFNKKAYECSSIRFDSIEELKHIIFFKYNLTEDIINDENFLFKFYALQETNKFNKKYLLRCALISMQSFLCNDEITKEEAHSIIYNPSIDVSDEFRYDIKTLYNL